MTSDNRSLGLLIAGWLCLVVSAGSAQVTSAPLLESWRGDHSTESDMGVMMFDGTRTDDAVDDSFRMRLYYESDRYRFDPADENSPSIGFGYVGADLITDHPMLPERFIDHTFTVGFHVGEYEGWKVDAVGGVGYAGDAPYNDANAWYALGNLAFSKKAGEKSAYMIVLNYDGNRTFLPDTPLPAMLYTDWSDPNLVYTLGVPFSKVMWRPSERVMWRAKWSMLYNFNITASYFLTREMELYAGYYSNNRAITQSGGRENRRLFFEMERVESGLSWKLSEHAKIVLAGGYAMDQEFNTGWDSRDVDRVTAIEDTSYYRIGVDLNF